MGTLLDHLRLKLLLVGETEISEIDVVLECEGELPVRHVVLVNIAVLHPSKQTHTFLELVSKSLKLKYGHTWCIERRERASCSTGGEDPPAYLGCTPCL